MLFLYPSHAEEDAVATVSTRGAEATGTTKIYQADENWIPLDWRPGQVVPGSALDLSGFLKGPAQREVIIHKGAFVFRDTPDQPLRFYGAVITHGMPYMEKKEARQFVDYLAACGFNAVRLHLYTFVAGVKEPGGDALSPEAQDKLDFFISCLKEKGIYLTLPVNSDDFFKAGDAADVPEFVDRPFRFESGGLLPISEALRQWYRRYATNLLGHKNPYTGLALRDDPVLMSLELTNENPLFMKLRHFPNVLAAYRRIAAAQLKAKSGSEPTPEAVDRALPEMVLQLQSFLYDDLRNFLRQSGFTKPITDVTVLSSMEYALPRNGFDYVDIHSYWALYRKLPGNKADDPDPPYRQTWANPNRFDYLLSPDLPLITAAARLLNKPFVSGEFNAGYATPYWTFLGPAYSALAGLQGWNGIYRCGIVPFPAKAFQASPIKRIESGSSPLIMFSERIGSLQLRDDAMEPRREWLPFVVTPEYIRSKLTLKGGLSYPLEYGRMAWRYRLGTLVLGSETGSIAERCVVIPADMEVPPGLADKIVLRADSTLTARVQKELPETPQSSRFTLDTERGTGTIVTPRTETLLLPADVDTAVGDGLSIKGNRCVSVSFTGSLDGEKLSQSRRVLALYLTDLKNTGTELLFEKNDQVVLKKNGALPLLIRQGAVRMEFKTVHRELPHIWALKYDGSHSIEVTPTAMPGGFYFKARAITNAQTFAAYEIVWP